MTQTQIALMIAQYVAAGGTITRLAPGRALPTPVFVDKFRDMLPVTKRLHLLVRG